MDLDEKEVRDGMTWLYVAGACAIALSIFLQWADYRLSTSDREVRLENTLRELRTAQATVGAEVADRRFDNQPAFRKPVKLPNKPAKKHSGGGDHGHSDSHH
jgi:hypothetical protein